MTNKPPPREFWICDYCIEDIILHEAPNPEIYDLKQLEFIHVIEKSAYEKLQAELTQAKEQIKDYAEALEFYAASNDEETIWDKRGVETARQALEKWKR